MIKLRCKYPGEEKGISSELSEIYDHLYEQGQTLIDGLNPCQVKDGDCLNKGFCCGGCSHLSDEGCTTDSLWCKLFFCTAASDNLPNEKYGLLKILMRSMNTVGLSYGRMPKAKAIEFACKSGQVRDNINRYKRMGR